MPPAHIPVPYIIGSGGFEEDDDGCSSSSSSASSSDALSPVRGSNRRRGGELDLSALHISSSPPHEPVPSLPPPLLTTPTAASNSTARCSFTRWKRGQSSTTHLPVMRKKLFGFAGRSELSSPTEPSTSKPHRTSLGLLGRRTSWGGRTKAPVPPEPEPQVPIAAAAPSLRPGQIVVQPEARPRPIRTDSEPSVDSSSYGSPLVRTSGPSTDGPTSVPSPPSVTSSEARPSNICAYDCQDDSSLEGTIVSSPNMAGEQEQRSGLGLAPPAATSGSSLTASALPPPPVPDGAPGSMASSTSTPSATATDSTPGLKGDLPQDDMMRVLLNFPLPHSGIERNTSPGPASSFASSSSHDLSPIRTRSRSPGGERRPSVSPRLSPSAHTVPIVSAPEPVLSQPVAPQRSLPGVPRCVSPPLLQGQDGLNWNDEVGMTHLARSSPPVPRPVTPVRTASLPHHPSRSPTRRSQTMAYGSVPALSSQAHVARSQPLSPNGWRFGAPPSRDDLDTSQAMLPVIQADAPLAWITEAVQVTGPNPPFPFIFLPHAQVGETEDEETPLASCAQSRLPSPQMLEEPTRLATPISSPSDTHSVATPTTPLYEPANMLQKLEPLPVPPQSPPSRSISYRADLFRTPAAKPVAIAVTSAPETVPLSGPQLHPPVPPTTQVPLGALSRKKTSLVPLEQRSRRFVKPSSPFSPGSVPTKGNALPARAWATIESALLKFQSAHARSNVATFQRGKLLRTVLQPFLRMEQNCPLVRPDTPPSVPGSASDLSSSPPSPGTNTSALSALSPVSLPPPSTHSMDIPASTCTPQHRPNLGEQAYEHYRVARNRRALLYDWISELLEAIKTASSSSDRLAILESIGMLLEARNLCEAVFDAPETPDTEREQYDDTLYRCLVYALTELNKKGVYQNSLIFAGRLLAHALFRIPSVAEKLLCALPVHKASLDRVAREAGWDEQMPVGEAWDSYVAAFPAHLRVFCFQDTATYLARVGAQPAPKPPDEGKEGKDSSRPPTWLVQRNGSGIQMCGNWLRRWQSDDSEVVFSFFRNFHRQLDRLIQTSLPSDAHALYFGAPAFAHIAASIHQKCVSLVHRSLNSVTTQQSQANFNPGETANVLLGSSNGKPNHLDAATARCVSAVVDSVNYGEPRTSPRQQHLFLSNIQLHLSCLVKRTSLYDVQGIFCLWDWIDALMEQIASAGLSIPSVIDLSFVISVARQILLKADHTVALMRTLAFCYGNFGFLMSTVAMRRALADETLLSPPIFTKLFLSWSITIRAYFLHTLVFRFGHITDFAAPADDPDNASAKHVARIFHARLDGVRSRYEEIISDAGLASANSESDSRRSSIHSTIRTIVVGPSARIGNDSDTDASRSNDSLLSASPVGTPQPSSPTGLGKADRLLGIPSAGGSLPSLPSEPSKRRWFHGLGRRNTDLKPPEDQRTSLSARRGSRTGARPSDSIVTPASNPAVGRKSKTSASTTEHLASNASFDLQSERTLPTAGAPHILPFAMSDGPRGAPPKPPRVSREFALRPSLVPGPANELVVGDVTEERVSSTCPRRSEGEKEGAFPRSLQPYAVQSLREYEQTVSEHDEFISSLPPEQRTDVPRLAAAWPAMWQGE